VFDAAIRAHNTLVPRQLFAIAAMRKSTAGTMNSPMIAQQGFGHRSTHDPNRTKPTGNAGDAGQNRQQTDGERNA
jgi:hypothetical protein